MPKEDSIKPRYASLQEAAHLFVHPEILMELLREGTLNARGRFEDYTNDPLSRPSEPQQIYYTTWRDYNFDDERFDLSSDEDQRFICQIEIRREDLDKIIKDNPLSRKPGGRPTSQDWDKFWREVVVYV